MGVLPPEAPGPNPGQPGHFAHTDWLTASVKALDAALETLTGSVADLMPVGAMLPYYGATPPAGWLPCDGSPIPASSTELIALVGPNTPDLRRRYLVGTAPNLALGQDEGIADYTSRSIGHGHGNSTGNVSHTGNMTAAGGSNQARVTGIAGNESGTHAHSIATHQLPYKAVTYMIKA